MDLSDVQNQLHENAKLQMYELIQQHNLGEVTQLLVSGHIQTEVHKVANELSTDLVIVGSHGRTVSPYFWARPLAAFFTVLPVMC